MAISGIDGAGKSHVAARVADELRDKEVGVALIHLDQWHTPPDVHFAEDKPGHHFYRYAIPF